MNYEFNQRQSEFYNRRRERNRYFNFNNRPSNRWHYVCKPSPGHECKEVPKPQPFRLYGVSSAQSQGADSTFATVTPSNPFTSRPPLLKDALSFNRVTAFTGNRFNLTVTIPTFSDVRSKMFIFQKSPAKAAPAHKPVKPQISTSTAPAHKPVKPQISTSAAPAGMFQQSSSCHTGNKIIGENHLKSDETGIDEDVHYLYTVQAKGGELVKVVDISEDSDHLSRSDESSRKILKIPEKETFKDAARGAGRKRKKSTEDLCCEICDKGYDFFKNSGEEIFRARCGHMFCQLCLKDLNPYKCPECDIFLQKLLKVCF